MIHECCGKSCVDLGRWKSNYLRTARAINKPRGWAKEGSLINISFLGLIMDHAKITKLIARCGSTHLHFQKSRSRDTRVLSSKTA